MAVNVKVIPISNVEDRRFCLSCYFFSTVLAGTMNHGNILVEYCTRKDCDNVLEEGETLLRLDESMFEPEIIVWLKKGRFRRKSKCKSGTSVKELDSTNNRLITNWNFCLNAPRCTKAKYSPTGEYVCTSNDCDNHDDKLGFEREFEEQTRFVESFQAYADGFSEFIGFLEE